MHRRSWLHHGRQFGAKLSTCPLELEGLAASDQCLVPRLYIGDQPKGMWANHFQRRRRVPGVIIDWVTNRLLNKWARARRSAFKRGCVPSSAQRVLQRKAEKVGSPGAALKSGPKVGSQGLGSDGAGVGEEADSRYPGSIWPSSARSARAPTE